MIGDDTAMRLAELRFLEQEAAEMMATAAWRAEDPDFAERLRLLRGDHQRHMEALDDLFHELGVTAGHLDEGFKTRVRSMAQRAAGARVPDEIVTALADVERVVADFAQETAARELPRPARVVLGGIVEDETGHQTLLAQHELVPAGWRDL